MNTVGIQIRRLPYEEPHHLDLVFSASNGTFAGAVEYYCNTPDLEDLGKSLQAFPTTVPDAYSYETGQERFDNDFASHVYTTDAVGHCALQVVIDNHRARPDEGACRFSIPAEPAAINRLGRLLFQFAKLRHYELKWTPSGEGDLLR